MVQPRPDLPLAHKPLVQRGVALDLGMRHLDGDLCAGGGVDGAVDRRHAAGGYGVFNVVLIQIVAGVNGHREALDEFCCR